MFFNRWWFGSLILSGFFAPILYILIDLGYVSQLANQIYDYQLSSTLSSYLIVLIIIPFNFLLKIKMNITEQKVSKYISIFIGLYLIINCIYFLTITGFQGNLISYEFSSDHRSSGIANFVIKKWEYFGLVFGSICIGEVFLSTSSNSEYKEVNQTIFKRIEEENNKFRLIEIREIYGDFKINKCKGKIYFKTNPLGYDHENVEINIFELIKKCKTDKNHFLGILRSDLEAKDKEFNFVTWFEKKDT